MKKIVAKFGGTSVGNDDAIRKTAKIISNHSENNDGLKIIVVVSAVSGITNLLVELCELIDAKKYNSARENLENIISIHKILSKKLSIDVNDILAAKYIEYKKYIDAIEKIDEMSPRTKDLFLCLGEFLSSAIISKYYISQKINAVLVDSGDLIKTDSSFNTAIVDFTCTKDACCNTISNLTKEYDVVVIGGFFGKDKYGEYTTLGRGGSDYSAAIIANAIDADILKIYTDVPGIMSADPKIVSEANIIKEISYNEAKEMADAGAKVLHPDTIAPALKNNIPVYIFDTFGEQSEYTKISSTTSKCGIVKSIVYSKPLELFKILFDDNSKQQAKHFFNRYGNYTKNITFLNNSLIISIPENEVIINILKEESNLNFIESIENAIALSFIGEGITQNTILLKQIIQILEKFEIPVYHLAISDINITVYIDKDKRDIAMKVLHSLCT